MKYRFMSVALIVAVSLGIVSFAPAEEKQEKDGWLAMAEATPLQPGEEPEAEVKKPLPVSFAIDYTLVSDYIWRGINLSEYAGEGREALNHQLGVTVSYETEKMGTFSANVWFEWYADNDQFASPGSVDDGKLQEVDYTLSWAYDIPDTPVSIELGWILYQFPQFEDSDAETTQDVYLSISVNDGFLFGKDEGVLNPYFAYYLDVDDVRASWMEFGISHDFAVVENLTVSPSLVLGIDHRYVTGSTKLANLTYGLGVSYDLSSALNIPEKYGALSIGGFVNYSQALADDALNDEFYGGMNLGWSW
ncbi:MAG: hypothetical protein ACLFVU_00240 [Phycisphaerae bacterium]